MQKIDNNFIEEILKNNFESITECSENIYQKYSNQVSQNASSNSHKGVLKSKIVFDNGWFYKNSSEFFFRKTGKYLLQKGVEYVTVNPEEFILNYDITKRLGFTSVSIQIQKSYFSDGWLWYVGDNYLGFKNRLRFYFSFNLRKSSVAKSFVKELAEILDVKGIAYKIKIEHTLTERNENAVLYFNKSNYYLVFVIVHSLLCSNKYNQSLFRTSNLLFVKTFPVFPGLAFAENPNDSELSFGEVMSNLVAEGILYKGVKTEIELNKFFKRKGYNPDALYLNPYTQFDYNFDLFDKYERKFGLIHIDTEILTEEHNLTSKIAMILAKHAIVCKQGRSVSCDWLKAEINQHYDDEVDYSVCDNEDKIEILEFLTGYIYSFKKNDGNGKLIILGLSDSDLLIIEIARTAFQSIKINTLNNSLRKRRKLIKDILFPKVSGDVNTPKIIFQDLLSNDSNNVEEALAAIKYNLKTRGIVSYLPDDEFNPNQKNFGYAYLGIFLLKRM